MSIRKSIELTVQDYNITLSQPLKLYKGDVVTIVFSIKQLNYDIITEPITGARYKMSMNIPINPLSGILLIETPEGKDSINNTEIIDNKIVFKLTGQHTSVLGVSKMQIILADEDGCRMALPEFEFEVKNTIADWSANGAAIVGTFNVGTLNVGEGLGKEVYDDLVKEIKSKASDSVEKTAIKEAMFEAIREQKKKDEVEKQYIKKALTEVAKNIEKEVAKEAVQEILKENKTPLYEYEEFEVNSVDSALSDKLKKRLAAKK